MAMATPERWDRRYTFFSNLLECRRGQLTGGPLQVPDKLPPVRALLDALRIVAGLLIIALLLYAASRITRDCTVGLYVYDICAWVWLREQLGLPASKFLRAVFLELIGLTLAAGIFFTIRYVFPFWRRDANSNKEGREAHRNGGPRQC